MKSIELQPSKENLLGTFEQNAIERNVDIYRFVNLLNAIEDNCSIHLKLEYMFRLGLLLLQNTGTTNRISCLEPNK